MSLVRPAFNTPNPPRHCLYSPSTRLPPQKQMVLLPESKRTGSASLSTEPPTRIGMSLGLLVGVGSARTQRLSHRPGLSRHSFGFPQQTQNSLISFPPSLPPTLPPSTLLAVFIGTCRAEGLKGLLGNSARFRPMSFRIPQSPAPRKRKPHAAHSAHACMHVRTVAAGLSNCPQ